MSIFSDRLKWYREKRRLSQKEMAEKIEMSPAGYGKIENGQREPNLEALAKISKTLKVSLDFLLGVTHLDEEARTLYSQVISIYFSMIRKGAESNLLELHKQTLEELNQYLSTTPHADIKQVIDEIDEQQKLASELYSEYFSKNK